MPRNQSGKPEHIHQNLNRKRKKSGKKYIKALKTYIKLAKRQFHEWLTPWIIDAKKKAQARLDKFGVSQKQIIEAFEKAGVTKKDITEFLNLKNS